MQKIIIEKKYVIKAILLLSMNTANYKKNWVVKISLGGSHEGHKQCKVDVLVYPPLLSTKSLNKFYYSR